MYMPIYKYIRIYSSKKRERNYLSTAFFDDKMNYDVDDDLREAKGNCVWCVLVSICQIREK